MRKTVEEKEPDTRDENTSVAAKYYVNQILSLDEEALQEAWSKVSHASNVRSAGERDARLQYLSWRVWGMKRKRALVLQQNVAEVEQDDSEVSDVKSSSDEQQVDAEDIAKLISAAPNMPRLSVKVAPTTASGEASPTEESELFSPPETPGSPLYAVEQMQVTGDRHPKLYCVLISMHGLVRGDHMELGKDPDTGGQVKYVVELAKALSRHPAVHRVDLLTRLVRDPKVDASYGKLEEPLTDPTGQLGGAYIARIPCGPVNQYLRKEALWPYVREFSDNALTYVCETMAKLAAAGESCELYDIHGHYADAGEAAALISLTLGVDMVLTGHSLGRNKLDHLLKSGTATRAEIEDTYAISRRIEGEERSLDAALLVFTSTQQEVKDQWGLYDGYNEDLERVVRHRARRGRHFPFMRVIPPGLDFSNLKIAPPPDPLQQLMPQQGTLKGSGSGSLTGRGPRRSSQSSSSWNILPGANGGTEDLAPVGVGEAGDLSLTSAQGASPRGTGSPKTPGALSPTASADPFARLAPPEDAPIWKSIFKFLRNPHKPVILAMSRPDAKKNITTLVRAYGKNKTLREIANLVLIMGNREVIDGMAPGSAKVLEQVLKLIDSYDLYGSVAYPKRHSQDDISDIYLLPAATRGVFVNIALQEPFGLTLIEAAAHGVPIVATTNGGPVDIINTLKSGILVEPTNDVAVAEALLKLLTNPTTWDEYAHNGVTNINAYSWSSHCIKCLNAIEAEKATNAKRTKHAELRTNYSASLDDFTFITSSGSFSAMRNGNNSVSASDGTAHALLSPRASATVVGQSFTTDDIVSTSSENTPLSINNSVHRFDNGAPSPRSPSAAEAAARSFPPLSPRGSRLERGLASTSMPLTGVYGGSAGAEAPVVQSAFSAAAQAMNAQQMSMVRDKYVVFLLDSSDTVTRLSKLLARKGKALMGLAAAGHSVGLGVATAFGLSETTELLQSAGLNMSDLDFAITNSGSEIWYCGAAVAGSQGSKQEPVMDDQYDHMLDAKWDLQSVRRVLAQCLQEKGFIQATGTAAGAPRPRIRVEANSGTHHLAVTLRQGDSAAAGGGLALSTADQTTLIGKIRSRFRKSGLRTQVVAQLENGDIKLHITPLRGSRALALRHLTYKHKVDMTSLVLVCCARDLKMSGESQAGPAKFACSDMEDVIAGVQGVLVVPPPAGAAAAEGGDGFPVDLGLYTHDGRLQLLQK
eukprot:GHUV01004177.1.p1 GENE.GHUV01004177.1~~GHUV01004177.1.p1  ORF type:complete len:1210 (+),score=383.57 GHUV01004177.1:125-3754(+)